jgi:hypothetical protein
MIQSAHKKSNLYHNFVLSLACFASILCDAHGQGGSGGTNGVDWPISPPANCITGANCLPSPPSDFDCDCDPDIAGPNATCVVRYEIIRVLNEGTPSDISMGAIICNNCGLCGCDTGGGGLKTCSNEFNVSVGTNIAAEEWSFGLQGTLGAPDLAALAATIHTTLPNVTSGGFMSSTGRCEVEVVPCQHLDLEDIKFVVRIGERWEVRHLWTFTSYWTTDACSGTDGLCPIAGSRWTMSCEEPDTTIASGTVLESAIDCGRTVDHVCE